MDSCNSSPPHSFKDRPRSRHGDPSRQPSFPQNLERAKSPAAKAAPEIRDSCTRDPARRGFGHCSAEKEGGDGLLSSPDRSRGSLRRSFGFERVERPRDSKTEMHRSARSCTPSRNPDKESAESGGRVATKRSSYGDLASRHENLEGVSSSSLQNERELKGAPRRGYDREEMKWRGSTSPEFDPELSRSVVPGKAVVRCDAKEVVGASPRRSATASASQSSRKDPPPDKDCTGSPPRKKDASERGKFSSPSRAHGREVPDDMDATSPKSKPVKVRDVEKLKEQEVSSNEAETRPWNKGFVSGAHSIGDDTLDGEQSHDSKSLHEEARRERSPISFLHISKRARSERERGRRDEHAGKSAACNSQWNELLKADAGKTSPAEKCNFDSYVKEGDDGEKHSEHTHEAKENEESSVRSADNGGMHVKGRTVEKECHTCNGGDNSDMEEGELEPESHAMVTLSSQRENNASAKEGEVIKKESFSVPIQTSKAMEDCDGLIKVDDLEKKKESADGDDVHRYGNYNGKNDDDREKPLLAAEKEEKQDLTSLEVGAENSQMKSRSMSVSTINKVLELGESSRSGLLFDLLGARNEPGSWNSRPPADKTTEPNRKLMLSLFTNADEVTGESSRSKGLNGKQIEKPQNLEAGSGEESTELAGHKQKKLKMESLQLSLALPESFNMEAGPDPSHFAGPAEPERSFQSLNQTQTQSQNFMPSQTYANSDGFTSSFSFSQSESFIHNPSCSLNCTSLENQELSCGGTRQLSQGTEQMSRSWPALSENEQGMHTITSLSHDKSKQRRGFPLYQRALENGNMGFPSVTGSNQSSGSNHVSQRNGQWLQDAPKILDSSSQDRDGCARHTLTRKNIMEQVRHHKAWFASKQQAMSSELRPEPNAAQDRDKQADPSAANVKGNNSAGNDIMMGERNALSDRIGLHEITTEPVAVMAQKLQELPDSFLEGLKGVVKGVLSSFEKREEFIALQENIRRRTDLTEDSLLRAHRTQLEILVALKTGIQTFVEEGSKPQTYKALIEIFLQTRCKNIACQQALPVCGCYCSICSKKTGFCSQCMCVVCYKFDSDYNTCRWLGCDICLHWCHTDCGLRMSYIRPTPKSQNARTTEMQYHCVCTRKLELHGYVKAVFQKCAETWSAETLAKELDCVRRIFHGSEDMRGKQLCWKAEQMLQELERKADTREVCRSMLRFLHEGNAELDGGCGLNKKSSTMKSNDSSARMAEPARESLPKPTSSGGAKRFDTQKFDQNAEEKRTEAAELRYERARKRAEIGDIESAVRIKQAEAKMFQMHADEALREARGLEQIILVKREKIDEDYACKFGNLRIVEARERHQKRLDELKIHENAQQCFQSMNVRMEPEIKELMVKIDMLKRQFA